MASSRLNHICLEIRPQSLEAAIELFKILGYELDLNPSRMKNAGWGRSRFVCREGSIDIQLIEPPQSARFRPTLAHIAFEDDNPMAIAEEIQKWAKEYKQSFIPEIDGDNLFITIKGTLNIDLELFKTRS